MNPTTLYLNIVVGALGLAYWIYGKKQAEFWFMIAGVGLMVYPWVVTGTAGMVLVGTAMAALPFAARRWL